MSLEERMILLTVLVIVGAVFDIIALRVVYGLRRDARRERQRAGRLVDAAAEHGKVTDNKLERIQGRSGEVATPCPPPPTNMRPRGPRGCGNVGALVLVGFVLLGWSMTRADAAEAMRQEGAANALEWWAAQPPGSR